MNLVMQQFVRSPLFYVGISLGIGSILFLLSSQTNIAVETIPTHCRNSSPTRTTRMANRVYYVSPDGSDDNPGTESQPFQTIQSAIDNAHAGDVIYIHAGSYTPVLIDNKHGTPSQPITLAAYPGDERRVFISADSYERGPSVKLQDSEYIILHGLVMKKSLWGLYATRSHHITLELSIVQDIGQEAVRFRGDSSDISITHNLITDTGNRTGFSHYGEGIYLGAGQRDYPGEAATRVLIHGNEISNTSAEAIDVKPFVSHVIISENHIHDIHTANSGAVAIGMGAGVNTVDVTQADNVVVCNNTIWNISRTSSWDDGNAIKAQSSATIYGNTIWGYQHRGIFIESAGNTHQFNIQSNEIYVPGDLDTMTGIVIENTDADIEVVANQIQRGDPPEPSRLFEAIVNN